MYFFKTRKQLHTLYVKILTSLSWTLSKTVRNKIFHFRLELLCQDISRSGKYCPLALKRVWVSMQGIWYVCPLVSKKCWQLPTKLDGVPSQQTCYRCANLRSRMYTYRRRIACECCRCRESARCQVGISTGRSIGWWGYPPVPLRPGRTTSVLCQVVQG